MKILIAEDQATAALFLRRTLERMGHEAIVVPDGEEALRTVLEQPIPLLISDWLMPKMDGLELCRQIRSRTSPGDGTYTYVILLTSKATRQDKLDGLRAGADDFLTKPPDPDELAVRLEIAGRILEVHKDLASRNTQLAELATIDELTGAKNRRRFREDLELHFALATRQESVLSVVMIDVDHFKQYNDEFGHPAGDLVLRTIVEILQENTREQDVVARYGGEEFVVLLPSTDVAASMILAERLRIKIEQNRWIKRRVTASLGVASRSTETLDPGALVQAADQALYRAKRAGRNRVEHSNPILVATQKAAMGER